MLKLTRMRTAFDRAFRNEQNDNLQKIEDANNELQSQISGLLEGEFEEAALSTHIEQKLNDLETEYAPKLTEIERNKADKNEVAKLNTIKADKTYVDAITKSLGNGSPKGTYLTLVALQNAFPSGNNNTYVVAEDGHWYYWDGTVWTSGGQYQSTGIAEKTITEEKTTFFNVTSNLFNKDTILINKVILSDGTISDNATYFCTDFIEIDRNKPLAMTNSKFGEAIGFNNLAQYDENKNFITRITLPTTQNFYSSFNVATKYVRFNGLKSEANNFELMVNVGSVLLPYEQYYKPYFKAENIRDGSLTPEKTSFFKLSKNLYNGDAITLDKVILSDGTITDNTSYFITDFIEIEIGKSISMTNQKFTPISGFNNLAQYDENKVFISRVTLPSSSNTYSSLHANTRFVRFNAEKQYGIGFDLVVNIGDQLLPYEPYGEYISAKYLKAVKTLDISPTVSEEQISDITLDILTTHEIDKKQKYIIDSVIPTGNYSAHDDILLRTTLEGVSYADIYQDFDTLASQNSDYITKTVLGADSSGTRDVNMYRLKPQTVSNTHNSIPKLVLTFCIHGSEKPALLAMLNIVNNLCKNYDKDPILKFLRWNVDIVLVPIVSPTGYNKNGRTNANNVDINRNFNYKWSEQTATDKGSNPNSEIETQYLVNLLNAHKDCVAFLDFHTYGSTENTWNACTKMQTADGSDKRLWTKVGAYVIRETTINSWKNYNVPKSSGFLGTMGLSDTNNAMSINYAKNVLGIESIAPEPAYDFIDGIEYTDQVNRFNIEFVVNSLIETLRTFAE